MVSAHVLLSHLLKIPFILSSHVHLFLPSSLFPSDLPTKPMCIYVLLQTRNIPVQNILINLNTQIIFEKGYHSQLHFLQSSFSSFKFGSSVLFSILFWKKSTSIPPFNKKYKVLHPLKTSCTAILQHVPCGHIVRRKTKNSESNCSKRSPNINFFILSCMQSWFDSCFCKCFISSSFQNVFFKLFILILSHIFWRDTNMCSTYSSQHLLLGETIC